MSLTPGTRLGPYEIQSAIGAGGMGEVYKAKDTRLDRTVAIKVLPAGAAADPDRRRRFEQEAHAASALNHPHICVLHDIGSEEGTDYLVMEHRVGETLATRLAKGPLPLDEALEVGIEIADALAVAHRQGIIHRDLKPGNVMLTKTGAKLLDFGLAKLRTPGAALGADFSSLPTQAAPETEKGTILGTLAYMAPEQLEGREADAHSDLFSFGAVLYEMLTGNRAFTGASPASVISAVMSSQPPPISTRQPLTPPVLERLVRQCLAKTPDDRPDSAHDVANDLRWLHETGGAVVSAQATARRPATLRAVVFAAPVLAALVLGATAIWVWRPATPAPQGIMRSLVSVTPAERLQSSPIDVQFGEQRPSQIAIAVSPDGRLLVFSAVKGELQQLYRRPVDQLEAAPIPDTVGGASPFFSPDGRWIGFWANGALKKVAVGGGPATMICEASVLFGASWGEDGNIVYAGASTPLFRVPAAGGTPQTLTTLDRRKGEVSHRLPHMLPGAKAVLFTAVNHYLPDWDQAEIAVQTLPGGVRKTVAQGADARYVPTGHLVFIRWGIAVAAPFDLQRLELTGGVVTIVNDVMQAANTPNSGVETGAAQLATSSSGPLLYATGGIFRDQERELVWVGRDGREQALPLPARAYLGPHLSPDGRQVVLWTQGRERVVWIYDLRRGTLSRIPTEGRNSRPIWTPDGRRVTFASATAGPDELVSVPADGSGSLERLSIPGQPSSWSPDGSVLAFVGSSDTGASRSSIMLLAHGESRPRVWRESRFALGYPEFSPDRRWLAFVSNETGRNEVYVESYPRPGERRQLSNGGGTQPAWARTGRELFYMEENDRTGRTRMMSVSITPGPRLETGVPRLVFEGVYRGAAGTRGYDVTADGKRFLMVRPKSRPPAPVIQLVLVQNWLEELKAKVPAK